MKLPMFADDTMLSEVVQHYSSGRELSFVKSFCCPKIRVLHTVYREEINTQSGDVYFISADMGARW